MMVDAFSYNIINLFSNGSRVMQVLISIVIDAAKWGQLYKLMMICVFLIVLFSE
jgi:hypothetical protein